MSHSTQRLTRHSIGRAIPLLLLAAALPARGDDANGLRFDYRPRFAIEDMRLERSAEVAGKAPYRTYYLVDNADLFYLQLSLLNISAKTVSLGNRAPGGWVESISFDLWRNGEKLAASEFAVQASNLTLRTAEYIKDGRVMEVGFVMEPGNPMAIVTPQYDTVREIRTLIPALPESLAPYEAAELLLRLTAPGGGPLPDGLYEVQLTYELPPAAVPSGDEATVSYFREVVVIGPPARPLDVVDSHVVRAAYEEYLGHTAARLSELRAAVDEVPNSIKAWGELANFYVEQEQYEEAIPCFLTWQALAMAVEAGRGSYEERPQVGSATTVGQYLDGLIRQHGLAPPPPPAP